MKQDGERKVIVEVVAWSMIFVALFIVAMSTNAQQYFGAMTEKDGGTLLADVFIALNVAGVIGLIYSLIRVKDLTLESRRRRQAEENVEWLARHDELTGLPNRRSLDSDVASAAAWARADVQVVAFYIDLDGFKRINDFFGHEVGNVVLKTIADRLRTLFPESRVYRVGSDEFVVLGRGADERESEAAGARTVAKLIAPIDADTMTVDVGASVGYAFADAAPDAIGKAILHADYALYAAKARGRNSVIRFDPSMEKALFERARLETDLKQAVRDGAIVPYFQPLIDLRTNKLNGFEALARWKTKSGDFITPSEFIPLAEETGLITELSEQLLALACAEARGWPTDIMLSFNLSPVLLGDPQIGLRMIKIMMQEGFPPTRLELEVTESSIVKDTPAARKVLGDLMQAGVKIALDDFGTGYSSLAQLSGFTFDKIKIDRSFVIAMSKGDREDKVIRAIVALSSGLGVKTTAEGIEDADQLAYLRSLGCDVGQGFLLGKPMSASDARQLAHAPAIDASPEAESAKLQSELQARSA
jgi:diguanylate cyclase (GGDEF)-like protein